MRERRHGHWPRGAWRREAWSGDRRPPWWPEGEPWPPTDEQRAELRAMRGRFLRRAAGFAVLAVLVVIALVSAIAWAVSTLLGAVFGGAHVPGFAGIVVLVAIVAALVIGRVVRRAAVPLADLIDAAGRVESGELGVTVREAGGREVRSLARAFNAMSRRLATTDDERRRLLADVSHELRTPLSIIQGTVEGMIDGVYEPTPERLEPILDEVRLLERLVEDLRTLSLAEAGQLSLHPESVDLAVLSRDAIAAFAARAASARVTLAATGDGSVVAVVDPTRLRQVIGNLLANALRATPADGEVTVRVTRDGVAGARIEVADSGSGMNPELAARAFERFSRAAGSPGSGLGLPIVRAIARAHGGEVELRSEPGHGTVVTVGLPG